MTQERAAAILTSHGFDWAPSSLPDHIKGLMHWTRNDNGLRTSVATWEDIELTGAAIDRWLGY